LGKIVTSNIINILKGVCELKKTACRQMGRLICLILVKRLVVGFPLLQSLFEPGSDQVGFVVDKLALGQVFLRAFRFPLLIFIPPNSPSSQSPGAGTIDQIVADVPSGPSLDYTSHYTNLKNLIIFFILGIDILEIESLVCRWFS
jgi:hypothetical protein